MKKIIYSLVIMIAAGSLFTSCIEPIEPAGIYDLREAKARYYDALSKLRAADALYREAQADHEKAIAEYQRALTENQNLLNYYQQLVNEAKELANEKEVEKWKLEIEALLKQREIDRINWEVAVAQANENRRQALSVIEMSMLDLTTAEKTALNNALGLYNAALADYQAKEKAVLDKEAALWDLKYNYENQTATYRDPLYPITYDINTGLDLVEYYEAVLAYDEMMAALYQMYYEMFAEDSDAAEWSEDLEALKAELEEEKYSRHEVTVDSVLFMEGVFHEANIQFGLEVDKWIEENEGVAEPEPAGAEPQKSSYPAKNYYSDTIAFPVFEIKAGPAYTKFVSLLIGPAFDENYAATKSLVKDTTHMVIVKNGDKLTLNATYGMKDFVLGSETPTTDSLEMTYRNKKSGKDTTIKAKWGLDGALSVLKRDKVLADETGKTQEEKEKEAEDALKLWTADRDSILLLYAAKKASDPIAEAYEPLADAMDALEDAKDEAESESGSLVKAAEKLITTVNGMISHSDMSVADSTNLLKAFVDFAAAREAYLDYTPYKNGVKYDNKNLFYFPRATSPDIVVDSIAFTDITFAMIDKHNDSRIKGFDYNYETGTQMATNNRLYAFFEIAKQLLGASFATAIDGAWPKSAIADATILNDGTNYTGFYGAYKYDNSTDPATIKTSTGGDYTPKDVQDAIDLVNTEADALENLWARFWDEAITVTVDGDGNVTDPVLDDKYNPDCYSLNTFTSPYNVVIFSGTNIVWTAAIGDILGSVDPKKDPTDATGANFNAGGFVTGAAVFEGALAQKTDFYQYMYKLAQTKSPSTTDIQAIEEWIGKVKTAFADELSAAETKATNAYNTAHSTWATKKANYDEKKPLYDAYIEKLKAFVGTDEDDNLINVTTVGGIKVPSLKAIAAPVNYTATQVKQTQVAPFQYEGEWDAEKIGGKQKEIADKLFVDEDGNTYPELLAAWRSEAEAREDTIGHLQKIIDVTEEALFNALKLVEVDDVDIASLIPAGKETVENYYKYALGWLEGMVYEWLEKATIAEKALEKAKAGYDAAQIAIFVAENELEYAEAELAEAAAKLAAAEEYYNTVIAHIFGEN